MSRKQKRGNTPEQANENTSSPTPGQDGATDLLRTLPVALPNADGGFTSVFESMRSPGSFTPPASSPRAGLNSAAKSWDLQQRHESALPNEIDGDFTQLFQRPSPRASAPTPPGEDFPASPEPASRSSGDFTQLLSTLSNDHHSRPPHMQLPERLPEEVRPRPEGPGEFTRIVSRPSRRESGTDEPQPSPQSTMTPAAAPPITPEMLRMSSAGAVAHFSPAAPLSAPPVPQTPFRSSTGGVERHVPALLIVNLCATILLIVMVAFLLLHHR